MTTLATSPDAPAPAEISRPPSSLDRVWNVAIRMLTLAMAWAVVAVVTFIVLRIVWTAQPAVDRFGMSLLTMTTWDSNRQLFGLLPAIWGTLYSSILGLAIGTFFGLSIAIVLSQDFLPAAVEAVLKNVIELLAAIPSVVYGLWGIFVVIPAIRPLADWLATHLGWIPLFGTPLRGPGMLPASMVLAIMVMPTVSALSRDALIAVPSKIKEAAYGLGATRWEAILGVLIPTALSGIFGSVMLGFGRALGETMALAMLVGNANELSVSLFSPGTTLAALLALNFAEARGLEAQVLMYAALVLLAITLVVNMIGTAIVMRDKEVAGHPVSQPVELTHAFDDVDLGKLETSLRSPRTLLSAGLSATAILASLVACVPLFSVLAMLAYRGGKRLSLEVLTSTPPAAFATGGGFGNAIVGTLMMVGIATVLTVPAGILAASYLALFGPESWTASVVRFCAKVLTGLPSVLAGVFAYAVVVLTTGGFSAPAGGLALAVLMLPTVLLTAEEAIRMVPLRMKEAAIGMGATDAQLLRRIVLPTAMPGILTGVMLAVARAAGETAPLLFTALFSNYWIVDRGHMNLMRPTASLAVLIYNFSAMPFANQVELAWTASLVLVAIVLAFNIAGQILSRNRHRR